MKVSICLLTYNRKMLFLETLRSIYDAGYPYALHIYDNGSTDGTAEIVQEIGGTLNDGKNHATGYGMNRVIEQGLAAGSDLIVFTADDFHYRVDWLKSLVSFWQQAPERVLMASCYLEPSWHWNEIEHVNTINGERYAIRTSIPGSNWTFRAADAPLILPISEKTGGEDLEICKRVREQGYRLAALDLVKHTGEKLSAWGNGSWRTAQPLDLPALGFEEWMP